MSLPDNLCPYVGLQPFTEEQQDFFFGRGRDVRVIASNLYASPLTVLYGDSGVGKSSVLLAGVMPHLKASPRTAVAVFREWQQPAAHQMLKAECLKAVAEVHGKPVAVPLNLPLDDFLMEVAIQFRGTTLIVLDQFEEYFIYNTASAAEDSFDAELARAINREEVEANFLIALREDGLAKLDRFRARIPHLLGNTLRLRHLDLAAAEEAIREPLRVLLKRAPETKGPTSIEDSLVEAVLTQVQRGQVVLNRASGVGRAFSDKARAQIETPYLQLVVTRLWEEELSRKSKVLRLVTLEELGGAVRIARTYLDSVMNELDANRREVCSRFFDRLITPSGGKIAYTVEDLTRYAGDLTGEVPAVLKKLADARILRSIVSATEQSGGARYEIFHDVLGAAILDWRRRFLADKAAADAKQKAAAELEAQRQEIEKARQLSEERARMAEERLQGARKVRLLTNLIGLTVVLAVVAGAVAWTNLNRRRLADEQRGLAEAGQKEAEAARIDAQAKEQEAKHLAEQANEVAQLANEKAEKARQANQAVVDKLQGQLDEAGKLIETYTQQVGNSAALAREYLEQAKKARTEVDDARAQARDLEAKAAAARADAAASEKRLREAEAKAAAARQGANQINKINEIYQQSPSKK